jgi:hypothetical protein
MTLMNVFRSLWIFAKSEGLLATCTQTISHFVDEFTMKSDLSLALAEEDWSKETALVKGVPAQAAIWSKRLGFFEGLKVNE